MEICKLCNNKEYKNLGSHLRGKHKMSRQDYDLMFSDETELTNELENIEKETVEVTNQTDSAKNNVKIGYKEQMDRIFNTGTEISENMTLGDFLAVRRLSLNELESLVKRFKLESQVPVLRSQRQLIEAGITEAEQLSDKDKVETSNTYVADALHKIFGFHCTKAERATNDRPKTWHFEKVL